jgi:hypothetical protein
MWIGQGESGWKNLGEESRETTCGARGSPPLETGLFGSGDVLTTRWSEKEWHRFQCAFKIKSNGSKARRRCRCTICASIVLPLDVAGLIDR